MKITPALALASALLLAAGCAREEHSARSDDTGYGYSSGRTEYNTHNNFSTPSTGGTYSEGNKGTYSANPGGVETSQGSQSQSDNAIVAQVRESLTRDPEIAFVVPNIQISANNGAIILSGNVQSEEQKRQIFSRVQNISGVVTVNNQLNVMSGPSGQENSNGSQLNPTSSSGVDRLYKDAANGDNSTNNALNPTSRENSGSQLYRESDQGNNAQDQNTNSNNNQQMP